MHSGARRSLALLAVLSAGTVSYSATFGTNVPVRGTVSDLALDSRRGKVYAANFSANRVEVLNTSTQLLETPFVVPLPPTSVAVSANGTFLVVGEIANPTTPGTGGLTMINLDSGSTTNLPMTDQVLAVAFGASNQALVVTTTRFLLLNPGVGFATPLPPPTVLPGVTLPVNFGTFPPNIVHTSTGVSGDGQNIIIVAEADQNSTIMLYRVGSAAVTIINFISTPPLGPVAVSVNQDASAELVGWTLLTQKLAGSAQFPYALGDFRRGGHAWDTARNVIYADIPVTANESPVLHLVDTDNLTVRERIQLPQMMAGRSLFSADGNTLYAISDSGILILPVASLPSAPRLASQQEDVLFLADACNRQVISKTINIVDLGGGQIDFKLTLPAGTNGVRLTPSSGTTPATVRIDVDPTVFQNAKGTTTIPLTLQSSAAINIPFAVRLLINTRDENQKGRIVNVPGKIVDMLADPSRNRLYMIRQDKNLVLVFDNAAFLNASPVPLAQLRTGNTPTSMTITEDRRYLIVGHDNSHYAAVFDLNILQASDPILFPTSYPRSVAAAHGAIWATTRPASGDPQLFSVDFANRVATAPSSLGIYTNGPPNARIDAVLAPSPSNKYILMAVPNFGVAMWDSSNNLWVVARTDNAPATGGAYGVLNDNLFLVDNHLLDQSLFSISTLESASGSSSGIGLSTTPVRTTAASASGPGTIERINLDPGNLKAYNATLLAEAPMLSTTMQYPSIGQIGETILPFIRTLALAFDGSSIFLLTQSGITVVTPDFDAPAQIPVISQMTNAADGGNAMASGGLVLISGQGLATRFDSAMSLPLPTELGEACFTVSNIALPLFRVSSTEVLAQLPFTVAGNAPVVARTPGGISSSFTVNILSGAPAIFRTGQAGDQSGLATVIRLKNNQLVTFTNPIHPSEFISIYLTGLGQTSPQAPLGDGAPFDPLSFATNPPTVTLGSTPLAVTFAGLAPGEVGVYLINAFVPGGVPNAAQTPLVVSQGTVSTSLQVRVVNP